MSHWYFRVKFVLSVLLVIFLFWASWAVIQLNVANWVRDALLVSRSTTIRLEPSNYSLSYTVAWGWGMNERIEVNSRTGSPVASTNWIEIWKKPYNSGAIVYSSDDHNAYYVGTSYNLIVFTPEKVRLTTTCDDGTIPERTPFGKRLSNSGSKASDEIIDPRASRALNYVESDTNGSKAGMSVISKYYVGLQYLGRFGIEEPQGSGRGDEVGFEPAGLSSEPRLGLQFSCG